MSIFKDETAEKAVWVQNRAKGLGGSDMPIVMGISPFKTPLQLWQEKTGKVVPEDISGLPHIQRGHMAETACRMLVERDLATSFTPKSWVVEGTPFRANDDGWSMDRNECLEIKAMGKAAHEACRDEKIIPPHYLIQVQWVLMCSGAKLCRFISYRPEENERAEIMVYPDPKEWEVLKDAALKFWALVQSDTPPPLSDRDYRLIKDQGFMDLSMQYVNLKAMAEQLSNQMAEVEAKLKAFEPDARALKNDYVRITRSTRQGVVDYKTAFKEHKIDAEKYRGKPSQVCTISILKGKNEKEKS